MKVFVVAAKGWGAGVGRNRASVISQGMRTLLSMQHAHHNESLYRFFRQNQDPAEAVSSYSQFACLCDGQLPVSELYVPDTRLRVEQRNARVSRQTGGGRGSITVIQNLEESQSML